MDKPFALIGADVTIYFRDIDTSPKHGPIGGNSVGRDTSSGLIQGVDSDFVYLEDEGSRKVAIPLTAIMKIVLR